MRPEARLDVPKTMTTKARDCVVLVGLVVAQKNGAYPLRGAFKQQFIWFMEANRISKIAEQNEGFSLSV